MLELLWTIDDLNGFLQSEDAEVRYWAVDRLIRHFPERCCGSIADHLLDEHDLTPQVVARHLGRHGTASHFGILSRGFRLLRGVTPGLCLQSLVRLGYPGVVELAASALKRGDLSDSALGTIVEALAEQGSNPAHDLVRQYIASHVELLAEPAGMRGMLEVIDAEEIPDVLAKFLTALQWRGSHRAGEAIRSLMDTLQIDDAGWCFRTGPGGHVELRKTIKAVESGYDCDISSVVGDRTINQIAQRFRVGNLREMAGSIAGWTKVAAAAHADRGDVDHWKRIEAAVEAFARQDLLDDVERLGGQVPQWLLGFQLSAAFAVARGLNLDQALKNARGNLDRLLELAEIETAFLLPELPAAIAVVCKGDAEPSHRAQDWCLRMLEAQGPFFPKVVALETLGELGSVHFISEVMDYLSDENSYVYGAAERSLSKMGEAIIATAGARIESGSLEPDAVHSLLVLLCDMGSRAAFDAVGQHLDWFMDLVGPGTAAEWVSLFGAEELIDPLRDWLDEDPAMVGQGLLLLGAIHNVTIPEEDDILRAIEDARTRHSADPQDDEGGPAGGPESEGGSYVM